MPGFDGTGPRGQGPFTGGGKGYCVGYPARGTMAVRGGFGRGRWFGRGFGFRGAVSSQNEARVLRDHGLCLKEEINAINVRLKELESSPVSEGNE